MTARARLKRRAVAALLASLLAAPAAHAISWAVHPGLRTALSHTDNVSLAPEGEERRETVLTVAPSIAVNGNGSRLDLEFLYSIDALFYLEDMKYDGSRQLLRGDATGTIEENFAYVDASTWVRRQPIDPDATAGLGDIAISETAGTGYHSVSSLSPYLQHAFGSVATVRTGLVFDYVNYEGTVRDSFGREIMLAAQSGAFLPRLSWNSEIRSKDVVYLGDSNDFSVQSIDLGLTYLFLPDWSILARAGYLHYDFRESALVEESPDGTTWRLGLMWSPSQQTVVQIGTGEHYYGTLRFLNFARYGQSMYFTASWDETVTTRREVELILSADAASDAPTDPQTPLGEAFQTRENAEVYISKLGSISGGYRSDRVDLGLTVRREQRTFQTRSGEEVVRGGFATLAFTFSPRTSSVYTFGKTQYVDLNGVEDVHTDAKLALVRNASERLRLSGDVQRVMRNISGTVERDYVSHVYSLRAEMRF